MAQSVNNGGKIVGYAVNPSPNSVNRAARWDKDGATFNDLQSLAGLDPAFTSSAFGINSAGYTVGSSVTSAGKTHAFRSAPGATTQSQDGKADDADNAPVVGRQFEYGFDGVIGSYLWGLDLSGTPQRRVESEDCSRSSQWARIHCCGE